MDTTALVTGLSFFFPAVESSDGVQTCEISRGKEGDMSGCEILFEVY
jgi:hypothetical protein